MSKWLITVLLMVLIFAVMMPHLPSRLRPGSLPGDVAVRVRGRRYFFPFTSTLLFSLLAGLLFRVF